MEKPILAKPFREILLMQEKTGISQLRRYISRNTKTDLSFYPAVLFLRFMPTRENCSDCSTRAKDRNWDSVLKIVSMYGLSVRVVKKLTTNLTPFFLEKCASKSTYWFRFLSRKLSLWNYLEFEPLLSHCLRICTPSELTNFVVVVSKIVPLSFLGNCTLSLSIWLLSQLLVCAFSLSHQLFLYYENPNYL